MNETEIVEDGARLDTRGRRRASAEERLRLMGEFEHGGQTLRAFAKSRGINYHTFVGWRARHKAQVAEGETRVLEPFARPVFHETRLAQLRAQQVTAGEPEREAAVMPSPGKETSTLPGSRPFATAIEVVLPNAIRVRCANAGQAAELLELLCGGKPC